MKLPPSVITLKVHDGKHRISLWLPVVILWPLLLLAAVILMPLALIAQLILLPLGVRPFTVVAALYEIVVFTRGTMVDVVSGTDDKKTIVKIKIV